MDLVMTNHNFQICFCIGFKILQTMIKFLCLQIVSIFVVQYCITHFVNYLYFYGWAFTFYSFKFNLLILKLELKCSYKV